MATIHHQLSINAPAGKVYEAISTADGIGTWWGRRMVGWFWSIPLVPNRRVEWECISTHPKSSPASAWTGTHFIFEIARGGDVGDASGAVRNQDLTTTLDFRQVGYDEQSEFFEFNKVAWGQVMQNLRKVVESHSS
jgi:uncharacterized protein YndB with AHSA1/START domain